MKKIIVIFAVLLVGGIVGFVIAPKNKPLGASISAPYYYFGATESSSSVPGTATTTNPILSLDNTRTNAKICMAPTTTSTVFLHQITQSTTTGVTVNTGIPLYPTSTQAQFCEEFPGFKGYLFGICTGNSNCFVNVASWK